MHPLISPINRLGFYLLAWAPVTAILVYLMAARGSMGWRDASVLMVPLCLVYSFVCLSAWYSCKVAMLTSTPIKRLLVTHAAAALIVSSLWVQVARLIAYLLSQLQSFQGLDRKLAPQIPLLFVAGLLLYVLAVASHYVILEMEESRAAQARVLETSILARDAELKALKSQINPHFLFNSLNSISALTSIDAARAREMCILLADFLRTTLGLGERAAVPLREELELLQRFLAIEKVRFGERLQVDLKVDAQAQSCLLPPLLLQPLVENAIIHGIAGLPSGGSVRISADCNSGLLHLAVENSVDPDALPSRRGGRGLTNVRQRLEARYGSEATLQVVAEEELYRVSISLPEISDASAPAAQAELSAIKVRP